jgi:hypothetical protein
MKKNEVCPWKEMLGKKWRRVKEVVWWISTA